MKQLVILDAARGLDTVGNTSPSLEDNSRVKANTFNRNVIRKIDAILEHYEDIDVVLLNTEKTDISLEDRRSRANLVINTFEKTHGPHCKKVLVSISTCNHNTSTWQNDGGTLIKCNVSDSTNFPLLMHDSLYNYTQLQDKGIVKTSNIVLLSDTIVSSAIICECACLDNKKEVNLMLNNTFKAQCAEGVVDAILKYFEIEKTHPLTIERDLYQEPKVIEPVIDSKIKLEISPTKAYIMSGDPSLLSVKLVNSKISKLKCINGINGITDNIVEQNNISIAEPNGILVIDGKIISNDAVNFDVFGTPQGVFVVYTSGLIELKRVKHADELRDLENIRLAVGGISLVNRFDNRFKFNPSIEGFKIDKSKADVEVNRTAILDNGNKSILGYNKKENLIYLICKANIAIVGNNGETTLPKLALDYGCDIAIAVGNDGFMFNENKVVFTATEPNREVSNIIVFN